MEQTIKVKSNFRMHQTHFEWEIHDLDKVYERTGGIRFGDYTLKGLGAKIYFTFYVEIPKLEVFLKHNQPFLCPDINAYVLKMENMNASMNKTFEYDDELECLYTFLLPHPTEIHELYIMNNTLTICCDIKYYEHIINKENLSDLPHEGLITASQKKSVQGKETVSTDKSECSDDDFDKLENQSHGKYSLNEYGKFFEESKLYDVAFVFQLEEVKAHREILMSKSPYFSRKLIKKPTNESEDYRIDCTGNNNISPSILRCFLEYLYGIKTFDNLRSSIGLMNIYILAKEYEMENLKIASEFYMTRDFV